MKPLTLCLPAVAFIIAYPAFLVSSYFSGLEYRTQPSAKAEGVVLKEDLKDHAKITSRYVVNGRAYEHVESAGVQQKDGKIDVYYLIGSPDHATYEDPEWIWYKEAVEKFFGSSRIFVGAIML